MIDLSANSSRLTSHLVSRTFWFDSSLSLPSILLVASTPIRLVTPSLAQLPSATPPKTQHHSTYPNSIWSRQVKNYLQVKNPLQPATRFIHSTSLFHKKAKNKTEKFRRNDDNEKTSRKSFSFPMNNENFLRRKRQEKKFFHFASAPWKSSKPTGWVWRKEAKRVCIIN